MVCLGLEGADVFTARACGRSSRQPLTCRSFQTDDRAATAKKIRSTAAAVVNRPLAEVLAAGAALRDEGLLDSLQLEEGAEPLPSARAADLVWSLGILGGRLHFSYELEQALALVDLDRSSPSEVTGMLWSLARARHRPARLAALCARAEALLAEGRLAPKQQLSALHSTATLQGAAPLPFVAALAARPKLAHELAFEQLAVCAWSLAVLDRVNTPLCRLAWEQLMQQPLPASLARPTRTLNQLHQVSRAVALEGTYPLLPPGQASFGEATLQVASGCWASTLQRRPLREVVVQREAMAALVSLGVQHRAEDTSTGISIDVSLPHVQVALEVDGPTHYPCNMKPGVSASRTEPDCLGHTAFKRRLLQQLGWETISLNEWTWGEFSAKERRDKLCALLQGKLSNAPGPEFWPDA